MSNEIENTCTPTSAYQKHNVPDMLRDLRNQAKEGIRQWRLRRLYRLLDLVENDSNIVAHAKRELPAGDDDSMQKAMNDHLIRMSQLFAAEGHSGFSAAYAISCLEKLLRLEPLGPLTGEPGEWQEVYTLDDGRIVYQNLRCSRVFKDGDQPYDIEGMIFREPDGACFTNQDSRVDVTFPYTPTREYVDVEADRD